MHELYDGPHEDTDDRDEEGPDKNHKTAMIIDAHAIVDPWAVVVVPFDALVAHAAVTRPGSFNHHAFWAQMQWIDYLHQFLYKKVSFSNV